MSRNVLLNLRLPFPIWTIFYENNVCLVIPVCSEHINRTINPYRELINEILFFLSKQIACIEIDNVFRFIFPKNQFFSIYIFQKDFGQDKYAVMQLGIIK